MDLVVVDNLDPFTERLRRYCADRGCRMLDLDPIVRQAEARQRPIRLRADPHFSREGQQLLAEAILDFLAQPTVASHAAIR
jgi:hypothetical protein